MKRKEIIQLAFQFSDSSKLTLKGQNSFKEFLAFYQSALLNHLLISVMNTDSFLEEFVDVARCPYTNVSTLVELYWISTPHQAYSDYMPEAFKEMNKILVKRLATEKAENALFEFIPDQKDLAKLTKEEKAQIPLVALQILKGEKIDPYSLMDDCSKLEEQYIKEKFDLDGTTLFKLPDEKKEVDFIIQYLPIGITMPFPNNWELLGYTDKEKFDGETPITQKIENQKPTIYLSKHSELSQKPYDVFLAKPKLDSSVQLSMTEMMKNHSENIFKINIHKLEEKTNSFDYANNQRINNDKVLHWGKIRLNERNFFILHGRLHGNTLFYQIIKVLDDHLLEITLNNCVDFSSASRILHQITIDQ